MRIKNLPNLESAKKRGLRSLFPGKAKISVGLGSCGIAAGAETVYHAFKEEAAKRNLDIVVAKTGCFGFCGEEPLVNIAKPESPLVILHRVTVGDVGEIIGRVSDGGIYDPKVFCKVEKWENFLEPKGILYGSGFAQVPHFYEIPFYRKQKKLVLRECGLIDPENIEEYIAVGGYAPLLKALSEGTPEMVLETVKNSGLRGRGGGGFPTGVKWEVARKVSADKKFIICNADEGDPGAYMNRNEMESDPHMLIEGMIIGAYAIGASEGIIYVRTEYPLAIERLKIALQQARSFGFLGKKIGGIDFDFDISMVCGAGAFVCGEETALIASIEGNSGRPRPRPPFPAERGLEGKPTVINNVETWCNVPLIMARGAQWFAGIGSKDGAGTKVFSLVGKVARVGLVEVPLGITLKEIIYEIGGGGMEDKSVKAVQTGGPSGGCIPASLFGSAVDYASLKAIGSIMGSGGMVVMDDDTCMIDMTKFFLSFTKAESCGKCIPCRRGLEHMWKILDAISKGRGQIAQLEELEELTEVIKTASLCGLGQTAPNPVLTTLKYFREEYEEHIIAKRCRAGVCESLFLAPCENKCPLNMNVPGYIQLLKENRLEEAYQLIMEDNPLPAVCGRVCHHPCEGKCRRKEVDGAVSIREIRRFIADTVREYGKGSNGGALTRLPATGRKIAVIGAGPAGLTAAYYLVRLGHAVTLYESYPKAGGMLRYGIPDFRLVPEILDRDIQHIQDLGVEFVFNTQIGKNLAFADLEKGGFDAIFIATGAHRDIRLGVPGEELEGVHKGMKFLSRVNRGEPVRIGQDVVVTGGGNVAIDCARVALRLGAKVTILYRREKKDMPALKEEIREAEQEGINFMFLGAPARVLAKNGKVKGIKVEKMRLGEFDRSGRRSPEPTGEFSTLACDTVITAIGGNPDSDFLAKTGIEVAKNGTVPVNRFSLQTIAPKVFAGGDLVSGPWTVTDAMGHGKKFAQVIDTQLMGKDRFQELKKAFTYSMEVALEPEGGNRNEAAECHFQTYRGNFQEVSATFTLDQAKLEATRCLRCDVKDEDEDEE